MQTGIVILGLIAVGGIGCTAPLQRGGVAPSQNGYNCSGLDSQHRTWGAIAKFSGALAGGGGLATLPISEEQKTLRVSVGVGSAVLGALAAMAVYVEQDAASTFAEKCVSNQKGSVP